MLHFALSALLAIEMSGKTDPNTGNFTEENGSSSKAPLPPNAETRA
jgi:hypothetical protein